MELAQAMVPQALALAHGRSVVAECGGGCEAGGRSVVSVDIVLRSRGVWA